MWNRSELKEKAKSALKVNYWKAVFVSLVFLWVAGGVPSTASINISNIFENGFENGIENEAEVVLDEWEEFNTIEGYSEFETVIEEDLMMMTEQDIMLLGVMVAGVIVVVFLVIGIIALIISLVWAAFIANPVEMGCSRFFIFGLKDKAEVKDVLFAFDSNYMNVMKVMFFRTLYVTLWSFLLWIPGIIKSYEYRMIPYLLAENPNLSKEEAFELSRRMMDGNKWKAFILDWSFFLWDLLSVVTLGLVDIFYVAPYKNLTNAALFEVLSQQVGYGRSVNNTYSDDVDMNPYANPSFME